MRVRAFAPYANRNHHESAWHICHRRRCYCLLLPRGAWPHVWDVWRHLYRWRCERLSSYRLLRHILVLESRLEKARSSSHHDFVHVVYSHVFDSRGNPIYNQPLVWLFGSPGSHLQIKEIVSHGGGSTGVNYEFQIVNLYGAIERTISGWFVMPFRFVEYLIVLSIVSTIITVIRNRSGSNWLPDNARP